MADKYASFAELAMSEIEGRDFQVRLRKRDGVAVVIAPHGGGIEPGTSEVADAIAANDLSFYAFEGIKAVGNRRNLHITSTRFDEPRCLDLVRASPQAISIHGEDSDGQVVYLGGRAVVTLGRIRESLRARGFRFETHESPHLQGLDRANICNQTSNGAGVQLELSNGLRRSFFESLSKSGRNSQTERFHRFAVAVREALAESEFSGS
jgi:phage replication-related protein YjqB (UPF0714/DUF867 family)